MIKLTQDQQNIFDDLINKIDNYHGRVEAVLEGPAGTGKSTVVSQLIQMTSQCYSIAVTSPTHKANSVLCKMMENLGMEEVNEKVSTIHSFLGLKLVNEKNRQVLKHDPTSHNSNKLVDILIIDECSMISDNLFEHIIDQLYRVRRAVIFVGDSCQLPPVEVENIPGHDGLSRTFEISLHYQLTNVLRQALDNPIIQLATQVRECIGSGKNPFDLLRAINDNGTVIRIPEDHIFLGTYYDYIRADTPRQIFDNAETNKIISFTNYKVDQANIYIRNMLFEEHANVEFVTGEPIVFESTTQNCPYHVQQMIECPKPVKESFLGIDCWQLKLSNGTYILAVGPHSKKAYNKHMEMLVHKINAKEINPMTNKAHTWQDYYIIKDKINVINYPYAITAHKSQGSTFDHIWFDTSYVDKIENNDMKCRILYTTITRPKYNIMLN